MLAPSSCQLRTVTHFKFRLSPILFPRAVVFACQGNRHTWVNWKFPFNDHLKTPSSPDYPPETKFELIKLFVRKNNSPWISAPSVMHFGARPAEPEALAAFPARNEMETTSESFECLRLRGGSCPAGNHFRQVVFLTNGFPIAVPRWWWWRRHDAMVAKSFTFSI